MKTLPCPFDGETPELQTHGVLQWVIECPKCYTCLPAVAGEYFISKLEAIAAWNKRVLPLELKEVLEDALTVLEIHCDSPTPTPLIIRLKQFLGIGKQI